MRQRIWRAVCAIGALALLTLVGFHFPTKSQFQLEPGGEYRGEIPGFGHVRARVTEEYGGPSIEICAEGAPRSRANLVLKGKNLSVDVFNDVPDELPIQVRCTIGPGHLDGFVTQSNAPTAAFHLTRICGRRGYRTERGLSFRGRGCSFPFYGEIPDLGESPFEQAASRYLMNSVQSTEAGDRAEYGPGWRDHLDAWIHSSNFYRWDSDVTWRLFYRTDNLISLVCCHYIYSGGAHGNIGTTTANFKWVNGRLETIRLPDLLRGDRFNQTELVRGILADLKRQEASWPDEKIVAGAIDDGLFTFDDHGLSFYFDPYAVGSYAEGAYVSFVSWEKLGGSPLASQ